MNVPLAMPVPAAAPPLASKPLFQFRTSHGAACVVEAIGDIDPSLWAETFSAQCKDARFYEVVAETLRGKFDHRYLILSCQASGERVVQPVFFVDQDVLAGLPRSLRRIAATIRTAWPRFCFLRILMVGSAVGEGHLACSERWAVEALREALEIYGKHSGAPLILFKDFPAAYRGALRNLTDFGYRRVPSLPDAELDLTYASFEDYLQRKLGKVFRKNLRRKFRKLKSSPELTMEVVTDVAPWAEEVFQLYRQTFRRSEYQFEELTAEYFKALGQRLPDRVRFFLWRQSERLVAVSVCIVHDQTLYELEIGLDYTIALDLHLYYATWRDVVQWAIDHKLKRYHTGPLNYDPKLHLQLHLSPLDLYAKHTSPFLNPVFGLAMKYLQPARHHRILAKFPNAHEL